MRDGVIVWDPPPPPRRVDWTCPACGTWVTSVVRLDRVESRIAQEPPRERQPRRPA